MMNETFVEKPHNKIIFSEWIRGIVTNHSGMMSCGTRINRVMVRCYLTDDSGTITCLVWEPISVEFARAVKVKIYYFP